MDKDYSQLGARIAYVDYVRAAAGGNVSMPTTMRTTTMRVAARPTTIRTSTRRLLPTTSRMTTMRTTTRSTPKPILTRPTPTPKSQGTDRTPPPPTPTPKSQGTNRTPSPPTKVPVSTPPVVKYGVPGPTPTPTAPVVKYGVPGPTPTPPAPIVKYGVPGTTLKPTTTKPKYNLDKIYAGIKGLDVSVIYKNISEEVNITKNSILTPARDSLGVLSGKTVSSVMDIFDGVKVANSSLSDLNQSRLKPALNKVEDLQKDLAERAKLKKEIEEKETQYKKGTDLKNIETQLAELRQKLTKIETKACETIDAVKKIDEQTIITPITKYGVIPIQQTLYGVSPYIPPEDPYIQTDYGVPFVSPPDPYIQTDYGVPFVSPPDPYIQPEYGVAFTPPPYQYIQPEYGVPFTPPPYQYIQPEYGVPIGTLVPYTATKYGVICATPEPYIATKYGVKCAQVGDDKKQQ